VRGETRRRSDGSGNGLEEDEVLVDSELGERSNSLVRGIVLSSDLKGLGKVALVVPILHALGSEGTCGGVEKTKKGQPMNVDLLVYDEEEEER
jgi:hypothetical protein